MNTIFLTLSLLLCLSIVSARVSFDNRRETDESETDRITPHISQLRHRKRRWQSNSGYEYPPLMPYYQNRREYDNNQQDLLPRITRLLEEISEYVKRPQQAPQPIYIPYPVPYPVPQFTACTPTNVTMPNITIRFPQLDDPNRNWGFNVEQSNTEDEGDGSRPISFEPIKPKRPMKRPTPKVEHGSEQAAGNPVTQAPVVEEQTTENQIPQICNAAIITCCAGDNQKQCFNNFGCGLSYNNGKACSGDSITAALENLKLAYSPDT